MHQIVAELTASAAVEGALRGRLVHRRGTRKTAIALVLTAAGDGHSAFAKGLIVALRGL